MNALTRLRDLSLVLARQPTTLTRKITDAYFEETRRRTATIRLLFLMLVAAPTVCATLYFGLWATPRYVSEAQFLVTKAMSAKPTGFDAILKAFGSSQVDDTSVVTGYLLSRDALRSLESQLPVHDIFARPEADIFSRFPRFWRSDSFERFFDYFLDRVLVSQDPKTGLTVLRVETFRPQDSQSLASALLKLAEKAVNDINTRAETDTLNFAYAELSRAEEKLIGAQQALTVFRTQELLVDPTKSSAAVLDSITRLTRDRAQVLAQKQQILASAPSSPAAQSLTSRADALQTQIDQERAQLAGGTGSLAPIVSTYERLTLLRDLAEKNVASAQAALEAARQEAQRQHLYIQVPISPNLSDLSTEPHRLRAIASALVTGFAIFAFIWILMVGTNEHAHR